MCADGEIGRALITICKQSRADGEVVNALGCSPSIPGFESLSAL